MEPQRAVVEVQVTAGTDGGHGLVAAGRRVEHPGHQRERRPEADRRRARDPGRGTVERDRRAVAARVGPGRTDRSAVAGVAGRVGHRGAGPFIEAVSDRWSRGRGTHGDGRPHPEHRSAYQSGEHSHVPVPTSKSRAATNAGSTLDIGGPLASVAANDALPGSGAPLPSPPNRPDTSGLLSCHLERTPARSASSVGAEHSEVLHQATRHQHVTMPGPKDVPHSGGRRRGLWIPRPQRLRCPPQAHPRPPRRDRTRLHPRRGPPRPS